MPIDTGDLTDKTYNAIMIEAENFDHNLTLQFGLLSYKCLDEADFIKKSTELIIKMQHYNAEDLENMFFGEPPSKRDFHKVLKKILTNISLINKAPVEKQKELIASEDQLKQHKTTLKYLK